MKLVARSLALLLACVASPVRGDDADLARQAQEVLKAHCYRCHGQDGANEGGFNYVLDRGRLVARKKLVPGNPDKSRLLRRLSDPDDPMPPADERPRPDADAVALLRRWVEAGAPAAAPAAPKRPALAPADVMRLVRRDLDGVRERDRRFTRYFTLAHLHNAGLSADELQSYRHGLSKLVNSLSWGPRVVVPRAIDPERTVFRIDLRDYQWNEKVWEAVLAAYPYGVTPPTAEARECATLTGCPLPCVRGDWFVAAASRPPLYHDVLQLPTTDAELERQLRVDVAEDVRQERVARAGFNGSGVSRNNRLIERHESGSVVYWKSYDFLNNVGRRNLFAHPLGPGGGAGDFRHDGGEIIFNLPNGLQGYLLVDGRGRRIDKGPTEVVSDPRRPDRAVENGLSCMSCHARGLIEKADQVRGHVRRNARAFARPDVGSVLALYPPADTFTALLREDARRFQDAVARTGAPLSATEPVAALALRFEAELDLPLAAAEAGVAPDELVRALERSPELGKHLGPLRVEGGTVQRQVFVVAFPDLAAELKLGAFRAPRAVEAARLVRRGDELARKGDTAAALEAYGEALRLDPRSAVAHNNRGLVRHRRGEADDAVADFDAAVRLDPNLAVAYLNRGAARQRKGELKQALADYAEAIRLEPTSAVAHNNRGLAHHEAGDHGRALADFDRALALDPKFAVAFNNRGLAHGGKGDHGRAVADFTRAIALDPKFARAYYNRAAAYEKKGDTARAAADRRKALELDPNLEAD
jgi:tetratricopeptide (TPR) repeat protein